MLGKCKGLHSIISILLVLLLLAACGQDASGGNESGDKSDKGGSPMQSSRLVFLFQI